MPRLLARAVRLVKIGAVAGAVVGVGRLVVQRRRRSQIDESSWPTIAETAAQNGQPVDDQSDDAEADPSEPSAGAEGDDPGDETEEEA